MVISEGEEGGEGGDGGDVVGAGGGFADGVHGPQGCAHVDAAQRYLRGEYIAEGGASGDVAVVHEVLAGHTGFLADGPEYGGRVGVGHILTVGIDFDTRAAAEHRMVGGILLFDVVGVESVGVVGRYHEGVCHGAHEVVAVAAEAGYHAAHNMLEDWRAGALLGARTGFLVVEYGGHAGEARRLVDVGQEGCDGRMHHAEVVDAAGAYHFVFKADGAGALGIVEREVVVEDGVGVDVELFGYERTYQALGLRAGERYYGQHVFLPGEWIALVDGAVEVYGQMRNGEQRTVDAHQLHAWAQRIIAAQGHASGYRQRTVEPCVEYRSAVDLGIELHGAALAGHLGIGLDAEAGRVAVCGDDVEAVGGCAFAGNEGENGRTVLHHIAPVARLQCPGIGHVETAEALVFEKAYGCVDGPEIYRRCVEEVAE